MVMQIKPIVVVVTIPRAFPLVILKGTAEQTFIFPDTPDPRSYKKAHDQAVVQKEEPVAKQLSSPIMHGKCVRDCTTQNCWSG